MSSRIPITGSEGPVGSALRAAAVRLSNVYGSVRDHPGRVVPAFARAAVAGRTVRMDGAGRSFDFTRIDDTVRAIAVRFGFGGQGARPGLRRYRQLIRRPA